MPRLQRFALILLSGVFSFLLLLILLPRPATGQEVPQPAPNTPLGGSAISISRNGEGRLNDAHLSVFGPNICTAYGDPFSPITPTWTATPWLNPADFAGLYTYRFQIRIPANYPDDVLRVEIFDPDSINRAASSDEVTYSALATTLNPTLFPPGLHTMFCLGSGTNQKEPCLIATGEESLVGTGPNLTIDHINPFWLVRVDENRGSGVPGVCGVPATYTPAYNTATRYELSYFRDAANGAVEQIALAAYIGQTGDGLRDNGDHDTDLRWVSPGGQTSFDQPVFVPANFGSFAVNLAENAPDMVIDPMTGERTLYLEITAVSGASENGFQLWAGPASYTNTVPSAANDRNLYILNNPHSHDTAGVVIEALDFLPVNSNTNNKTIVPLATIGPEYAGQTITVTHFDMDAGAKPPVVFYMDSLAFTRDASTDNINELATDFAVSYGGEVDPDGRCFDNGPSYSGECNNTWVNPVYTITLPSEQSCDYSNPTPQTCTPFYGGHLLATLNAGFHDSYAWTVSLPERPAPDTTLACSAFPIGLQQGVRSVLPPDDPGSAANSWPDNFQYPLVAPVYARFVDHQPNIPLTDARPGYLYKIDSGLSAGNFTWLNWNVCSADSTALENSLAWPGNSRDYTPLTGSCAAFTPRVAGYVEPGDPADRSLHRGDHIAAYTGVANTAGILSKLAGHVDLDRTLRLPIWQESAASGADPTIVVSRFGLFRVVGYNLTEGWLMVEFVGWDDSCGQTAVPLDTLTLSGPTTEEALTNVAITAVISPDNATTPILYTWEATDLAPIDDTGGTAVSRLFTWTQPGPKTITVTAANGQNTLTATHALTITAPTRVDLTIGPLELVTTPPITAGQPVTFRTTISNTGNLAAEAQFFVDVFLDPGIVLTNSIPITQSDGYTAVGSLAAGASQMVTLTAPFGFAPQPPTHTVYAMVDSLDQIDESNESNNISAPLTVTGVVPLPSLQLSPACGMGPLATFTILGSNWPVGQDVILYWQNTSNFQTRITGHDGSFAQTWTKTISEAQGEYTVIGVSGSYVITAVFTVPCTPQAPTSVVVTGPASGPANVYHTFTAHVSPDAATYPITYVWEIAGGDPITHTGGLSDTVQIAWPTIGETGFTVLAQNVYGRAQTRYIFEVTESRQFLPFVPNDAGWGKRP